MRPDLKKLSTFSVLALAVVLSGAIKTGNDRCNQPPPVNCYPDGCNPCYCLGPENILVNAPVSPITCSGDIAITVALLAWQADQDGLEYAIDNQVFGDDSFTDNASLTNLIDASYKTPGKSWDVGVKLGVGYANPCDGWDVSLLWTYFQNKTKTHVEAEQLNNHTLLPLWSAFQFPSTAIAPNLFATDIETCWKLHLNLIDLELGRNFWVSHYLSF